MTDNDLRRQVVETDYEDQRRKTAQTLLNLAGAVAAASANQAASMASSWASETAYTLAALGVAAEAQRSSEFWRDH